MKRERRKADNLSLSELKAYQRMANLCSRLEYSSSDIKQKLLRWGLNDEQISRLLNRLITDGFIDDWRFARSFARDRLRFNGWGKAKIEWMLRKRGVSPEIVAAVLEEIDQEIFKSRLREIISTRASRLKKVDEFKRKSSLLRFALSRGYSYEDILQVLEELGL